ncbi:MAG: alpha/beta fold hydrolase [Holophagaceae bacterium]|nr:alpha/beta fold hydrolase [Holophagaceae bacterium]
MAETRTHEDARLEVLDMGSGLRVPIQIQYPSGSSRNPWPLILLSHGGGGSNALYRTISSYLAQRGYVVAMPEHPRNHRKDNSLGGTHENLVNRPRHLRLAADAVMADPRFSSRVLVERIAVIGHSLGGYTALALAGGLAWDKEGRRVEVEADPRLQALVLLAPATAFFSPPGSLAAVTQPILLLSAEHDTITPRWQAELIQNRVPDPSQFTSEEIPGAGHFSFLSPFPLPLRRPGFPPSEDPPGFDREAFHLWLPERIRCFLDLHLKVQP